MRLVKLAARCSVSIGAARPVLQAVWGQLERVVRRRHLAKAIAAGTSAETLALLDEAAAFRQVLN